MSSMGLLGTALTDYVGVGNLTTYKVRFTKQTWPDEVLTTKVGPHREDGVVLVIAGPGERGCLVPSRLAVEHGVIELLHALPGFDSRRLVAAMERPPPARTTCWERAEK